MVSLAGDRSIQGADEAEVNGVPVLVFGCKIALRRTLTNEKRVRYLWFRRTPKITLLSFRGH